MTEFTCAHCGEPSSQQGHYMAGPRPCPNGGTSGMLDEQGRRLVLGFNCRLGHACLPVRVPAELATPPPDSLEKWAEAVVRYLTYGVGNADDLSANLKSLLARARALGVGK